MKKSIKLMLGILIISVLLAGFVVAVETDIAKEAGVTNEKIKVVSVNGGVDITPLNGEDPGKITWINDGSIVRVGDAEFTNITPKDDQHRAYIKVDKDGKVVEADFFTNDKGGTYQLGNEKFYAPPNSRVYYDGKKIQIIAHADSTLTADQMPSLVDSKLKGSIIEITANNLGLPNGNVMQSGKLIMQDGKTSVTTGSVIDNLKVKGVDGDSIRLFLTGESIGDLKKVDGGDYISLNADTGNMAFGYEAQKTQGNLAGGTSQYAKRGVDFLEGNPFLPVMANGNQRANIETLDGRMQGTIKNADGKIPNLAINSFAIMSGTSERSDYTITDGNRIISYDSRKGTGPTRSAEDLVISYAKGGDFNSVPMTVDLTYRRSDKDISLFRNDEIGLFDNKDNFKIIKKSKIGDDDKLSKYLIDNDWITAARNKMLPVPPITPTTVEPLPEKIIEDAATPVSGSVEERISDKLNGGRGAFVDLSTFSPEQKKKFEEIVNEMSPGLRNVVNIVKPTDKRGFADALESAQIWVTEVFDGPGSVRINKNELDKASVNREFAGVFWDRMEWEEDMTREITKDFAYLTPVVMPPLTLYTTLILASPNEKKTTTMNIEDYWIDVQEQTGPRYWSWVDKNVEIINENIAKSDALKGKVKFEQSYAFDMTPRAAKKDFQNYGAAVSADPSVLNGIVTSAKDIQGEVETKIITDKDGKKQEVPFYKGNGAIQKLIILKQSGAITYEQFKNIADQSHLRINPETGKPY